MILQASRRLGAVAVLATGAVHLQQYIVENVWAYPTIATLFLLNIIGCGVMGIALLAPLGRVLPDRHANAAVTVLATTALLIAVGSLVFLFISESAGLFGFTETGYRTPVVLAIIAECATILLLAPVLAKNLARALYGRPEPPAEQNGSLGRGVVVLRPGK
jgi:multisubunit Na+/H+ antiporter MnhG subunit